MGVNEEGVICWVDGVGKGDGECWGEEEGKEGKNEGWRKGEKREGWEEVEIENGEGGGERGRGGVSWWFPGFIGEFWFFFFFFFFFWGGGVFCVFF